MNNHQLQGVDTMVAILRLEARRILAGNIKKLRRIRKITQRDLSWYTGLSYKYIKAIEHAEEKASIDDIFLFAKTFDVTYKELFC